VKQQYAKKEEKRKKDGRKEGKALSDERVSKVTNEREKRAGQHLVFGSKEAAWYKGKRHVYALSSKLGEREREGKP
jgi:hypothetical protein